MLCQPYALTTNNGIRLTKSRHARALLRCGCPGGRIQRAIWSLRCFSFVMAPEVIDQSVNNWHDGPMARPREFDRDTALERARLMFWANGYVGTSTDDLVTAMGIGRQSLYNAFGDKWQLYVEALTDYQQRSTSGHVQRLQAAPSALQGVRDMLEGLVAEDDALRALGCMGVGAACEFGASEPQLLALRHKGTSYLRARLLKRIRQGQLAGEIDPEPGAGDIADYIMMSMTGIQLASRGGGRAAELRRMARFAADRLRAR